MGDFDCANPTDGSPLLTSCCTGITALVNVRCYCTLNANGSTPQGFFPAGEGAALIQAQEALVRYVVNLCNQLPFPTTPNTPEGTGYYFYNLLPQSPGDNLRLSVDQFSQLNVLTPRGTGISDIPYRRACQTTIPELWRLFDAVSPDFSSGSFYGAGPVAFEVVTQKAQVVFSQPTTACFATFPGCTLEGGIAQQRSLSNRHILPALDPVGVRGGNFGGLTYRILGLLRGSSC